MKSKKLINIPNILSLGNLFCGCIAIVYVINGNFIHSITFVCIGLIFDFLDGFAARILSVQGELGKQLDSLADVVTFGVAPGIHMIKLIEWSTLNNVDKTISEIITSDFELGYLPLCGLLIPLFSALRLAKFNIDERQTTNFIGLPTPACTVLIISMPVILIYEPDSVLCNIILNQYFLLTLIVFISYLMISEIRFFSLKIEKRGLKNNANKIRLLFLLVSIILFLAVHVVSIPLTMTLYIGTSILLQILDVDI
ncbi:CDP-alcohol phosphatidyltransferase family protein [Ichthyobacterium seriolicida]|uniref:Phosphatidylserine synthase n=1 Tax=Ichthyobacterium seriolicida TaxID=242600 RepID=A0A1J1DYS1_9FLAO|nr:CDP-alcohol phosphatidyltransferase family protein [Ichthyobacterium seriolicida]BAV95049.1 phosphatidylserine synthase [Ichthyobacterium seriolicida]